MKLRCMNPPRPSDFAQSASVVLSDADSGCPHLNEACQTDVSSVWLLDSEVVFPAASLRFRAIPTAAPDILSPCRAIQYKIDRPRGPFDVFHQVDWTRNIRRSRHVILSYPTEAAKD